MIKETNLLKLSNVKMKSTRLRKIIVENKEILDKRDCIEILIEKKEIKKEEVEKSNIDSRLEKQIRILKQESVSILTVLDEEYPGNLIDLEDSPPILYCRGKVLPKDSNSVSIVGTRRATEYGKTIARTLGKKLSGLGITVISGMAMGIDTQAHIGALEGNGRTLAIMGTGIDLIYPASNRNLAQKIVEHGALLTELPPLSRALPYHFPARNRIISGLSKAVIAVEAAERSGVFSTVRWALEYGRDVYALPGDINRKVSEGTNKLIKNGAIPLTSYKDILENTGLEIKEVKEKDIKKIPDLSEQEEIVYKVLEVEPKSTDVLVSETGLNPKVIMTTMALLELKGLSREISGKRFIREEL
ncbi:DNA-processing protein DprA [candidate division WOR-3 bacterium]|nr:DNA-processing protein DprA [candidate division WOR-3 bacterium]